MRIPLLVVSFTAVVALNASAQHATNRVTGATLAALSSGAHVQQSLYPAGDLVTTFFAEPPEHKNIVAAAALSAFIPGVGSFYAGNSRHGFVHLGVHVLSAVLIIGTYTKCSLDTCGTTSLAEIGFPLYIINDIWSIVTAVGDATDANASNETRLGRVAGNFHPVQAIFPAAELSQRASRAAQPLAVRLVKLSF